MICPLDIKSTNMRHIETVIFTDQEYLVRSWWGTHYSAGYGQFSLSHTDVQYSAAEYSTMDSVDCEKCFPMTLSSTKNPLYVSREYLLQLRLIITRSENTCDKRGNTLNERRRPYQLTNDWCALTNFTKEKVCENQWNICSCRYITWLQIRSLSKSNCHLHRRCWSWSILVRKCLSMSRLRSRNHEVAAS